MTNVISFLHQHKKQIFASITLFFLSTLVAGIILVLLALFSATKHRYKTTSILAQSASLFLSPYLLVGEIGHACSIQTFRYSLSLLSHADQFSQIIQKATNEYNQNGISETTINDLKPYIATIDQSLQTATTCQKKSPIFRGILTAIFQNNTDLTAISKSSSLLHSGIENIHTLGGYDTPQHILILIQNNRELRATGGFLGSYAYLTISNGKVEKFELQDIYVPDGRLNGHVEPPQPIQDAFQQGFWKLRDANWHPDFPQTVTNISWFFEQAGWEKPDTVVAVDVTAFEEILKKIEPIYLAEFGKEFQADEIYPLLQTKVEEDFFAGSTKKKDMLQHTYTQVMQKLSQSSTLQKIQLAQTVAQSLEHKHLLLFSTIPSLQQHIESRHFGGALEFNLTNDYFSIFESNMGVNKSNCCVLRNVHINKTIAEQTVETTTQLHYQIDQIPEKFTSIAGDYKTYIRLYYPNNTTLQYIKVNQQEYRDFIHEHIQRGSFSKETSDDPSIGQVQGLTEIGFWIYVPEQSLTDVEVVTTTVFEHEVPRSITIQKQPGTMDFFNFFQIETNQKNLFDGVLKKDMMLKIK